MIFRDHQGNAIGDLDLDNYVYSKEIRGSEQKNENPGGWAISVGEIDTLFTLNCIEIKIIDLDTDTIFSTPLTSFTKKGVLISRETGDQIFAIDKFWKSYPRSEALAK